MQLITLLLTPGFPLWCAVHIAIEACCTRGVWGFFFFSFSFFFFFPEKLPEQSDIDEDGSLRLADAG